MKPGPKHERWEKAGASARKPEPASLEEALRRLEWPPGDPVLVAEAERWMDGEIMRPEVRIALSLVLGIPLSEVPE